MAKKAKDEVLSLRITEQEAAQLDVHTQGQVTRSMVVRVLLLEFLGQPVEQQRQFLTDRLFRAPGGRGGHR